MISVNNDFKTRTKKIKQQNIKLSILDGELTVKEVHFMTVKEFNSLPVWMLRKRQEVIAKELKYSFEGNLFKTIMKQIEITVKNAIELKDKNINFQYGIYVNNDFEYIDLGDYYIKDVEDDKGKTELIVTGYDKMIHFMKTFKQSELQLTYPCTMLELIQKMCEVCGVGLYSTNFFNADLQVDEDYFTTQELTYRDVLEKVAESTETTIFIKDNKLYLHKLADSPIEKLDASYLTGLTVKEKFGPVNALVLGRGDVEDNVEAKDDTSIAQNGRCEIRFDENEFIEYQREQVINEMFEQIKGLEYYAFEGSDVGVMWLEPCDLIEVEDNEESTYKTIYLKANITINTGISSDIEANIPKETNTEYKVTTKEEKKTLKVERLAKKNEGQIQDLIQETTEQGQKLTQVEQTVDGINQKVENIQDLTVTTEAVTTVPLSDCMKGYLMELHIYGNNTVFDYLYPSDNLYPGDNLYPYGDSRIEITDNDSNSTIYELGVTEVLRQNGEVCDEYILQDNKASIIRRINKDGTIKENEEIEELGEFKINLSEGNNTIKIKNYTARLSVRYVVKNDYTDVFTPTLNLGTEIEQNAEAVRIAWNQISEFIQMMIINNNASFAILDKDNNVMMSLDKEGLNFYNSNETEPFGEMGVKKVGEQNYVSFSVLGEYGQTIQDGMAWGITIKEDNKFLPILYMKDFSVGDKNSETGSGKLVLSSCDIVLDSLGAGIEANSVKIHGDAMPGVYFTDTNNGSSLLSIIPNIANVQDASIYMLDNISFFKNQAGSNSFKIGNNNGCLFSDDGHILCENLNCNQDIYCWQYLTARKGIDCPEGYVSGIAFHNNSREENKSNIEKFNKNAIEIIKNTDIYEFNYKAEKEGAKKHLGFVIGENYNYAKEITAEDNKNKETGADIYSMISVAYKAIQEQQEIIETQQKTIEDLQKQINELKSR